jgi:hypothetical protein
VPTPASTITGTCLLHDDAQVERIADTLPDPIGAASTVTHPISASRRRDGSSVIYGSTLKPSQPVFRFGVAVEACLISDYFQLDQVADARLARQPTHAHRVFDRITAGRIVQNLVFFRIDKIEQVFCQRPSFRPATTDRDDLHAALFNRRASPKITILASTDDQPRLATLACQFKRSSFI